MKRPPPKLRADREIGLLTWIPNSSVQGKLSCLSKEGEKQ